MVGRLAWLALALSLAIASNASASAFYVGDSLGVGTVPYVRQQLEGVAVAADVLGGRPSPPGVDIMRSELGPEHDVVVFDLGTNDNPATPEILAADLDAARQIAGDRCLVIATLNRPPVEGVSVAGMNRAVTAFAARDPNTELVDWHGAAAADPSLLIDGIHSDGEGYALRASLFVGAIRSCLAGASFGAADPAGAPAAPLEHESGDLPPAASAGRHGGERAGPEPPAREDRKPRERRLRALVTELGRAIGTGAEFG